MQEYTVVSAPDADAVLVQPEGQLKLEAVMYDVTGEMGARDGHEGVPEKAIGPDSTIVVVSVTRL